MWIYSVVDTSVLKLGARCDFYFPMWPFFDGWKLQFEDNKEWMNTAHIQVIKFEGNTFPFCIHLSSQIPGKLSFIAKNITESFSKLLKSCQNCIFQKLNISHGVPQIFVVILNKKVTQEQYFFQELI